MNRTSVIQHLMDLTHNISNKCIAIDNIKIEISSNLKSYQSQIKNVFLSHISVHISLDSLDSKHLIELFWGFKRLFMN